MDSKPDTIDKLFWVTIVVAWVVVLLRLFYWT
ncbi:hypothetical protein [Caudoviricetes sp.]|nr:hypothetical protein [Caudoviricetes sp.]